MKHNIGTSLRLFFKSLHSVVSYFEHCRSILILIDWFHIRWNRNIFHTWQTHVKRLGSCVKTLFLFLNILFVFYSYHTSLVHNHTINTVVCYLNINHQQASGIHKQFWQKHVILYHWCLALNSCLLYLSYICILLDTYWCFKP